MTVNFENEYDEELINKELDFDYKEVAEKVIEAVLDYEGCPYEASVELIFTTEEAIQEMNQEHRQINRVTDVLSFPMVDYDTPGDFSRLDEDDSDMCFDPDSGELMLGDIVLCIPRVLDQAREYGHSRKREYAFLIAHSMLHLLGYDHMTEDEASEMEKRQTEVLDQLGIKREGEC